MNGWLPETLQSVLDNCRYMNKTDEIECEYYSKRMTESSPYRRPQLSCAKQNNRLSDRMGSSFPESHRGRSCRHDGRNRKATRMQRAVARPWSEASLSQWDGRWWGSQVCGAGDLGVE